MFWLLKAYFKRWRKTFIFSFIAGSIIFLFLSLTSSVFVNLPPFREKQVIGLLGSYTKDNLPTAVSSKISTGLTIIGDDGKPLPGIAESWVIKDNGKTYIFYLKRNVYFTDKTRVTSDLINYNFIDVSVERPDEDTIIFKLRDSYSPFLITVSRPIFKKDYLGVGEYKLTSIDLNGDFVRAVELTSTNKNKKLIYQFYPTENSLKIAFLLGEITKIDGVSDLGFLGTTLDTFPGFKIEKGVDYSQLATLFYNTQDNVLSDERLRRALSFATPENFMSGQRSKLPYPPNLWATTPNIQSYTEDTDRAKLLLSQSSATQSANLSLTIKTLRKYKNAAEKIKSLWDKIGIETKIEEVDSFPQTFQVFLGEFNVPKDPDQYVLWHSSQGNNITGYVNLRIDKLLEDGRRTVDPEERAKIYADFQRYLLEDPPATFLFFPDSYTVSRK